MILLLLLNIITNIIMIIIMILVLLLLIIIIIIIILIIMIIIIITMIITIIIIIIILLLLIIMIPLRGPLGEVDTAPADCAQTRSQRIIIIIIIIAIIAIIIIIMIITTYSQIVHRLADCNRVDVCFSCVLLLLCVDRSAGHFVPRTVSFCYSMRRSICRSFGSHTKKEVNSKPLEG